MFDTSEQIERQLLAGEDSSAEFKALRLTDRGVQGPNAESVAGEMVAFANADGGTLFLGVGDDGVPLGIPRQQLDAVERWCVNIATANCDPPIRPIVRKHIVKECKHLILAEIPRGLYVHRTTGGRYYQRVGSTKRDVTPSELARLFQQRGREYVFDERAVLAASVSDLNQHRLEAHFAVKLQEDGSSPGQGRPCDAEGIASSVLNTGGGRPLGRLAAAPKSRGPRVARVQAFRRPAS